MQMPVDSKFRFGASTRTYILRERPQTGNRPIMVGIKYIILLTVRQLTLVFKMNIQLKMLTLWITGRARKICS